MALRDVTPKEKSNKTFNTEKSTFMVSRDIYFSCANRSFCLYRPQKCHLLNYYFFTITFFTVPSAILKMFIPF